MKTTQQVRDESMDVCRSIRAAAKEALGYLDIPDDKTPEPQKQVYDLLTNIKVLAVYYENNLEAWR